eukprot:TRINITY_DN43034_c0_g1_i1.p1 TRINITY_DN43034_c0_g1~~TRINITY_DN43034_c0_g1_i1.p1  ORF type:complete len:467 (+),score=50.21 TRINITY_DN43034_c0_g1_i1:53-1402(+)
MTRAESALTMERRQNRLRTGEHRRRKVQQESSGFTPFDPQSIPPGPPNRRHRGAACQPPAREEVPGLWQAKGTMTPRTKRAQNRALAPVSGSPRRLLRARQGCPFGRDEAVALDAHLVDGDIPRPGDHQHERARDGYSSRRRSRSEPPPDRRPRTPGRGEGSRHNVPFQRTVSQSPMLLGPPGRQGGIRVPDKGGITDRNLITGHGVANPRPVGLHSPVRRRGASHGRITDLSQYESSRPMRRQVPGDHVSRTSLIGSGQVGTEAAERPQPDVGRRGPQLTRSQSCEPRPRGRRAGGGTGGPAPYGITPGADTDTRPGSAHGTPFRRQRRATASPGRACLQVGSGLCPVDADGVSNRASGQFGARGQAFDGAGAVWVDPRGRDTYGGRSPVRSARGPALIGSGVVHQDSQQRPAQASQGNMNRRARTPNPRPDSIVGSGATMTERFDLL